MSIAVLQIGNNYPGTEAELRGCLNDLENFSRFSRDTLRIVPTYYRHLTDAECTAANWRSEIERLMATPETIKIIQQSGHGTKVKDLDGDEADRFDEAYVPFDYLDNGVIPDDYLAYQYGRLRPHERLIVLADSCFSGTSQRGMFHAMTGLLPGGLSKKVRTAFRQPTPRFLPPMRYAAGARGLGSWLSFLRRKKKQALLYDTSRVMLLATSRETETSADAWVASAKQWHGAGTFYILEAARLLGSRATYRDVQERANLLLQTNGYPQRVQFEGTASWLGLPFFT